MYIGDDNGEPYVIHDVSSISLHRRTRDEYYEGVLNGVSVTPLSALCMAPRESPYVDLMYNIKRIR